MEFLLAFPNFITRRASLRHQFPWNQKPGDKRALKYTRLAVSFLINARLASIIDLCASHGIKYSTTRRPEAQCRKCSVACHIPLHKSRVQPVQLLSLLPSSCHILLPVRKLNREMPRRRVSPANEFLFMPASNWYLALFSISEAVLAT